MRETWVQSLGWEDPLEKEMALNPVFLPGESHGQKSLVGYSPWGTTGISAFPLGWPWEAQSSPRVARVQYSWASLVAQLIKNLPAVRKTWVQSLGWEDPLENERLLTPITGLENSITKGWPFPLSFILSILVGVQ